MDDGRRLFDQLLFISHELALFEGSTSSVTRADGGATVVAAAETLPPGSVWTATAGHALRIVHHGEVGPVDGPVAVEVQGVVGGGITAV